MPCASECLLAVRIFLWNDFACSRSCYLENVLRILYLPSGDNLGCFGANKKKKEAQPAQQKEAAATTSRTQRTEPVKGMELLWQPEVKNYPHTFEMLIILCEFLSRWFSSTSRCCKAARTLRRWRRPQGRCRTWPPAIGNRASRSEPQCGKRRDCPFLWSCSGWRWTGWCALSPLPLEILPLTKETRS